MVAMDWGVWIVLKVGLEKHEGQVLKGNEETHRDENLHQSWRIEDGLNDEPLDPHANDEKGGCRPGQLKDTDRYDSSGRARTSGTWPA